jgi:hypothetical protein
MKKTIWFWLPRISGLLFSVFLGLFALDVFDIQAPLQQLLIGFAIHLIPALVILFATLIAWRWERLGGLLFLVIAITAYFFFFHGDWPYGAIFSAILALIGLLFLWSARRAR